MASSSSFAVSPESQGPMTSVSLIGCAGRKEDAPKMTSELFDLMCENARAVMGSTWKLEAGAVVLVSGGSAWADHVAVRLFLEGALSDDPGAPAKRDTPFLAGAAFAGLELHLPCEFDACPRSPGFFDTGSADWQSNPGRVLNSLHRAFGAKIGANTLLDLSCAIALGAQVRVHAGFHARNRPVARSQRLLAWTWGAGAEPKDGGTAHTWGLCKAPRLHVPLSSLSLSNSFAPSNSFGSNSFALPNSFGSNSFALPKDKEPGSGKRKRPSTTIDSGPPKKRAASTANSS